MSAPVKAERGERKKQALKVIKQFERDQRIWTSGDLARELKCSQAQAWQLISSLTLTGELKRGTRTVVIPEALVTA